jgi:hypothetical protein
LWYKEKEKTMKNKLKTNLNVMKNRPLNKYGTSVGDKVYIRQCDRMCANNVNEKLAAEYYSILGWEY